MVSSSFLPAPQSLVLLASLCVALGCSRAGRDSGDHTVAPGSVQLIATVDGLSAQHRAGPPILERISCPPRADCLTSRLYRDGTLYYLVDTKDGAPAHWNRIARVTSGAVQSLEKLYQSICGKQDPVLANDSGSDRHRVTVQGCTEEFVVTGIPAGPLAPIQQVTQIINSSVIPGSGASPD